MFHCCSDSLQILQPAYVATLKNVQAFNGGGHGPPRPGATKQLNVTL